MCAVAMAQHQFEVTIERCHSITLTPRSPLLFDSPLGTAYLYLAALVKIERRAGGRPVKNEENTMRSTLIIVLSQKYAYYRIISKASACLQYMMTGSSLIKVRPNSRQYHRFFTLAEDMSAIRWTPTSKKASKAMDSIKEIRVGKNTEVLRNRDLCANYTEDCTFSILYGETFESLDLVAPSTEEANIWVTGLNALIGAQK
ncbi:hypothetical protein B566_EDAN007310, partial [Ephemera danica]